MKLQLHLVRQASKDGIAMIAVLVILLALFALSAPFLMSVRNADRSSAELTDRAAARLALDSALRHAHAHLGDSHPSVDRTPDFDSLDEFDVGNEFAAGFYSASDPKGAMWDVEVDDLAGLIDLNSASPHLFANLMGGLARSTQEVDAKSRSLEISNASGFGPLGFFWFERELVSYGDFKDSEFKQLKRGLLWEKPEEGEPEACGPGEPENHAPGTYVIDQRSFGVPLWRIFRGSPDRLATLDSIDQVAEAKTFTMIDELPTGFIEVLKRTSTVHGHVAAGAKWQNQTRVLRQLDGEDRPSCRFLVQDTRFINPGSTVRIEDGERVEFGIVRDVRDQRVELMDALVNVYDPQRTTLSVLARRPVNINTASPEVLLALMENLRLRGKKARITSSEAESLAQVIIGSRPITSFEDFVRRIVLPAGGFKSLPEDAPVVPAIFEKLKGQGEVGSDGQRSAVGFIDEDDARALYKNARNANDRELLFSTLPFSFTSRDLYRIEMRSSINARSGVERAHRVREQIELIVPQKPLLKLWHRQQDFEEEGRLDRAGPGWVSGPEPTARTSGMYPSRMPSRSLAHLGNYDSAELTARAREEGEPPVLSFPSREGEAWLQLSPARTPDRASRGNRILHFDFETRSLEGHYLPDGVLSYRADDPIVQFTGSGSRSSGSSSNVVLPAGTSAAPVGGNSAGMNPITFEMWIKPQGLAAGANFLSAGSGFSSGGPFGLSDLVELTTDGTDLILRVRDGLPDHLGTPEFEELAEVRYPINEGAGLPLDVWSHISVGISGTRPDQMRMLVDGRLASDVTGMTRLSSSLGSDGTLIVVESTQNFPNPCVLLIGEELIEATVTGANSFEARFQFTGVNTGFGGRLARETFRGANPERNEGLTSKQTSYPQGTTVQLYGYSLPLASDVSDLRGSLTDQVGIFAAARAVGIKQNGETYDLVPTTGSGVEDRNPEILVSVNGGLFVPVVGYGLPGAELVEEISLASVDAAVSLGETLQAFSRTGGYAALIARTNSFAGNNGGRSFTDPDGYEFGGIEIIRYAGVSSTGLILEARGDSLSELNLDPSLIGRKSFIFQLNEDVGAPQADWPGLNESLTEQTFVIPISIPVNGQIPMPLAPTRPTELIQLTHVDAEAAQTEWVRYDRVARGSVVRADLATLLRVQRAALGRELESGAGGDDLTPPPTGGNAGGSGQTPRLPNPGQPDPAPAPTTTTSAPQQQQAGAFWHYAMGQAERTNLVSPVSDAISSSLQFRGVMGTFSHFHQPGTVVLPVLRFPTGDVQRGMPGRFDKVTLFEEIGQGASRGVPATVHRAHRASQYLTYSYQDSVVLTGVPRGNPTATSQDPEFIGQTLVALESHTAAITNSNVLQPGATTSFDVDTRTLARMAKFPAGELPRSIESVTLGGSFSGGGSVPSAEIDEVVFGTDILRHQKILDNDIGESGATLGVRGLRYPGGDNLTNDRVLRGMRAGSGLIRIGDEIMAYSGLDLADDTITIPDLGRGLLGSTVQPHAAGEGIVLLEDYTVGMLTAAIDAEGAYLELETAIGAAGGFPGGGGLVLVERELIHYTGYVDERLTMPVGSEIPGRRDGKGAGIFRGRFGTDPDAHPAGTPVILFPFRYWDRWSPEADEPELDFFEFSLDQPGAFWNQVFWDVDEGPAGGVRLGVLQRLGRDTPWDTDPLDGEGLDLMYRGRPASGANPIGAQADSIQWRAFVEYERGAFDAVGGLSHGWKTTPRLRHFGVEYVAPSIALQRIER